MALEVVGSNPTGHPNNCRIDNWEIEELATERGLSDALKERTKKFALKIVTIVDGLPNSRSGEIIGRQMIRSATSVGANYRAACRARSHGEFVAKMHIVAEEADETQYWLDLLRDSGKIPEREYSGLAQEASELTAIFTASVRTARLRKSK